MQDLARLSATEVVHHIQNGRTDPMEWMEACLDRIAARNGERHAFAHFDAGVASRAASGTRFGPLVGMPIGVKDVLDTADMPSQYGSPIWQGWRPRADCAAVAAARAAGAIVIGKTVTTEFATRTPGPTTNPANAAHTPGGSSSGSAAGVADYFFPVGFGTQTAGSIIRPAAYCGAVGYKPSFGSISRVGMKLMSDSLDTVGVVARSVADCALFAAAVTGRGLGNPDAKPDQAPRIGICKTFSWSHAAPETQALMENIATALSRGGAKVSDYDLPAYFAELEVAHPIIMNHESGHALGWELNNHRGQISSALQEKLDVGLAHSETELAAAYATFERTQAEFSSAMGELDILVTPAAAGEAPRGIEWTGDPVFNYIWTSLHVPCVTVPAGTGPNGLPLGIQIVGRRGADRAVLAFARWVEAALG